MGSGTYSADRSATRAMMYSNKDRDEIFVKRSQSNLMRPFDAVRECVDSQEHPNTIPIIIALDETGSMGHIPEAFVRDEMSKMMSGLYSAGLGDSQVLFMGIGDIETDRAPLQVGQFEADDELMDKWLKEIYLEGCGGGNDGESYSLAWAFAARGTKIDSFEKRGKKGYLFTIGDENDLPSVSNGELATLLGTTSGIENLSGLTPASTLLQEASEKYNVFHIHTKETRNGSKTKIQDSWKQNLGENVLFVDSYKEIANLIAEKVNQFEKTEPVDEPVVSEIQFL